MHLTSSEMANSCLFWHGLCVPNFVEIGTTVPEKNTKSRVMPATQCSNKVPLPQQCTTIEISEKYQ